MKITLCGDLCPTQTSIPLFLKQDLKGLFGDTLEVFGSAGRVIVNLECALTERGTPIKKCGPNLKGPVVCAKVMKDAGITDCGLSNNHIFDFGKEGLFDTLKALDDQGINWTGIGENEEASRKDLILDDNGQKIALITVCEHEYTYALEDRVGARPFDPFDTMEDIKKAKESAGIVIVMYHGGKEQCEYPSPRLRKLCRAMVKNGADIVLCQHSHCIGCYEKFEDCHILYGQGNFHFVKYLNHPHWETGLVLNFDTMSRDIEFLPVSVIPEGGIRLVKGAEKQKILDGFYKRSEALKTDEWKNGWRKFCLDSMGNYVPAIGEAYNENSTEVQNQRFAHYLDCEAHCDVWRELFYTWNHTNEK
jgi:hypothetical protein